MLERCRSAFLTTVTHFGPLCGGCLSALPGGCQPANQVQTKFESASGSASVTTTATAAAMATATVAADFDADPDADPDADSDAALKNENTFLKQAYMRAIGLKTCLSASKQ